MTAKEDLVEPNTNGDGRPVITPTTVNLTEQQQQQTPPPDYETSIKQENEIEEVEDDNETVVFDDNGEPKFPTDDLMKLEEQLNRVRWIVPVLADGELIKCLRAAVRLAREKLDTKSEACQRFIRDSLVISFTKIFCDDAVQSWKYEIYRAIYKNAMVCVRLCVLKLDDDCLPLLEILSFIMNPQGRYHQVNYNRGCLYQLQNTTEPFSPSLEYRGAQRGWLVDLINKFGDLGGFDKLLARFTSSETKLTISLVVALLKPWGLCYDYLTQSTIKKYFEPIIEFVSQYLDQLSENDLKMETKSESKSDTLSAVIKWLRHLASRIPENDKACRKLDVLRLKIILRLLQTNSFSGKMNALNEVNKLLPNLSSTYRTTFNRPDDMDSLTSDKFIKWLQENAILDIVLRDCLHQPQYVEKLEKLLRFIIKEQALSRNDLAKIWNASCGKHEAIEKNVHDLLAKLAWDFTPEQLEQLFDCFRESWTKASKKQREKLLELIRRLAEDDKEGLMANKVLELLWNISHDEHLPTEIIEQALAAHLKILDYSYVSEKDKTKIAWIDRILDEIKQGQHVLFSIKHIREICSQFHDSTYPHSSSRMGTPFNRLTIIDTLEKNHKLSSVITKDLCHYMDNVRRHQDENKILPPEDFYPDGRFNHNYQIHERLTFLKFILKDGRQYLGAENMKQIWLCLAERPIYSQDREQCFRWFADIIDDVGFESRSGKEFFQNQFMKLDPHHLTDLGMNCFDRFFKSVNAQSNKFQQKRRSVRLISDEDLIGGEYLWKVILNGSDEVANRGIQLIKEIYTNISPQLKTEVKRIHQTFMGECFSRLKHVYGQIKSKSTPQGIVALIRLLTVLREYLAECDYSYHKDRNVLPMARAYRGRPVIMSIRFPTTQNRQGEDFDYQCHSNDTWGQIRRMICNRYKTSCNVLELLRNNDLIYPVDDNKTLGQTDGRDRITISVRWVQHSSHAGSSGDSSSSESEINNSVSMSMSHQNRIPDGIDISAENVLPSVLFSQKHEYYQFLIEISDLGCKEQNTRLRDTARHILDLVPVDPEAKITFTNCFQNMKPNSEESANRIRKFYFHSSPTQILYNLKTTLIRLAPASFTSADMNEIEVLHVFFLHTGGLTCLLYILTQKQFTDQCDTATRKSIYLFTLSILKRLLIILGYYQVKTANSPVYQMSLEHILNVMPVTTIYNEQQMSISLEFRIASLLLQHATNYPIPKKSFLQYEDILELIRLIWCLASNNKQSSFEDCLKSDFDFIHQAFKQDNFDPNEQFEFNDFSEEDEESQQACREGLELLCMSIALVPSCVERLIQENFFEYFLIDLVLYCHYPAIRHTASDQIFLLTTHCAQGQHENLVKYLIDKQFQIFNTHPDSMKTYSSYSLDFFQLLCRLLSFAYLNHITPSNIKQQLHDEMTWLTTLQLPVDDHLLRGHLNLAKELLQFQTSELKRFYGIEQSLIQRLIEQFLFPPSTLLSQVRSLKQKQLTNMTADTEYNELIEPPVPICQSPMTTSAAFDLLVILGTDCIDNLKLIDKYLTDLFYSAPDSALTEWDFSLPIGSRPNQGFVGLKNACATCYMNSVLQQLFMIKPIRTALLAVKIPPEYGEDEFDEDDVRRETSSGNTDSKSSAKDKSATVSPAKNDPNEYHIQILRQIQRIFGHCLDSKLQYYVPRGFWKLFKFAGEAVNVREQQDAVEFLNTVIDNIDEALKVLKLPQICSRVLRGTFADQKICKDCPHRYTRDEDFTLLSVDIRHSQNLKESLEQYVIGELLDGPNAYFCEKCNKTIDTVKRTCFKRLPPMLAIQLKRFDYDWERETPIKFNDYFEFPRELDMEPYTVQGLARAEGTSIIDENDTDNQNTNDDGTRYKLVGIIVHMGQANGGHYYSFIQHNDESDDSNYSQWYKFDDTDVSECKMNDDEELRSQCFGGDHSTSPFDQPVIKRQRRCWNAYILFYEKLPTNSVDPIKVLEKDLSQLELYDKTQRMPLSVQRSVRKQNIKFLHNRILFSPEYFLFIRRLVHSNVQQLVLLIQQQQQQQEEKDSLTNAIEELALIAIQITAKFLFTIGWHTKKSLRGAASEWTELVTHCLRYSRRARQYFVEEVLFKHPNRFHEYLIDCMSADIRNVFGRILVTLATHSRQDEQHNVENATDDMTVEEKILNSVIRLMKKDGPDNLKMSAQYFQFFINYSSQGRYECEQLIRLNVPLMLAKMIADDLSSTSIHRYGEPSKLSIILSTLIRCFDVSSLCKSSHPDEKVLPNPYRTYDSGPICPIPNGLIELLYKRDHLLKKLIEDAGTCEELTRFLRFVIWENPDVTAVALRDILTLPSMYYSGDLRTHLEILSMVLLMEDSWQEARLLYALKGIPINNEMSPTIDEPSSPTTTLNNNNCYSNDVVQSLFDLYSKSKSSNEKRAYQFMKTLLQIFTNCPKAYQLLQTDQELKDSWIQAVRWLHDQLERPNYIPSFYSSQGQVTSNDLSQGCFLERTQSAKSVLAKAGELCSDKENDDDDEDDNSNDIVEMDAETNIQHILPTYHK
ncbi:unnamed protein product [Adineta ricciae]|uniref:ubiquitinyl hydrolase 1 n=1 Tax=Adineta ricciae TaxID=249248 RepID=A0A813YVQ9_ADIRI|nr:unnamed protein product [Adineta ricciae]CAF1098374.1 unnamed protein product [Adineta ricciae]